MNGDYFRVTEDFAAQHGRSISAGGGLEIYQDGARIQHSMDGMYQLFPLPDPDDATDEDLFDVRYWISQYWKHRAEFDAQEFNTLKAYLSGSGKWLDHWPTDLFTNEDKLEFLKRLKARAKRSQARYAKEKFNAKQLMPQWRIDADEVDIEQQAQRHGFKTAVDEIEL